MEAIIGAIIGGIVAVLVYRHLSRKNDDDNA